MGQPRAVLLLGQGGTRLALKGDPEQPGRLAPEGVRVEPGFYPEA